MLAGLGFSQEMMDGDVGELSGGWKMRVGAGAHPADAARRACCSTSRRTTSTSKSMIWLEQFLKGYDGALLMTSHDREFMNRIVTKIIEIDGGDAHHHTPATTSSTSSSARSPTSSSRRSSSASRRCWPRRCSFIERFKARAAHAAQVQSRVKKLEKIEKVEPPRRRQIVDVRFPAGAALAARTW
ncbi:MAG: hypothetical protein MZV49_15025 [Rhodopseudomonas palustris]|nr:hypothetical protein [Rhodopseudomonas palustris]